MKKTLVVIAVLFSAPAFAQEQPKFVPFTMDEQTFNAIQQYLGDVPSKYAVPLIQLLNQKAQAAKVEATQPKESKDGK